jgi:uncharacterized small protein (DUF1192 family)
MNSQAQVIGKPPMKTWDDYEQGCLDTYGGGHRFDGQLEAFRHGMQTVFNLLRREFPPAEEIRRLQQQADEVDRLTDRVEELTGEIERLRADYAKLHGAVETYIDAPAQIRGEAYRDLAGTMEHLAGRDDGLGWAACWRKQQAEIERLRAERDLLEVTE